MGGSFNTREFFHGISSAWMRAVKWVFLLAVFPMPLALLAAAWSAAFFPALLAFAFVLQYPGLLAERWFFFAQANHPQNLYYQASREGGRHQRGSEPGAVYAGLRGRLLLVY